MTKTEALKTNLAAVGENIGQELGAKMVKTFQDKFPTETEWHFVGRNIISEILSQPNCSGIRFYNAIDEGGNKTFVFVGIDNEGNIIDEYSTINTSGEITKHKGIVADRIDRPGTRSTDTTFDWWTL